MPDVVRSGVMRPTLIGEMPSPAEGPDAWQRPLSGRVCGTLCGLAGLEPPTYDVLTEHFDCKNVVIRPSTEPAYLLRSWWSSLEARTRIEQIMSWARGPCVLLGRKVAEASGRPDLAWGEWDLNGFVWPLVVIPHPSGLNRLYNEITTREMASRALSEALSYQ